LFEEYKTGYLLISFYDREMHAFLFNIKSSINEDIVKLLQNVDDWLLCRHCLLKKENDGSVQMFSQFTLNQDLSVNLPVLYTTDFFSNMTSSSLQEYTCALVAYPMDVLQNEMGYFLLCVKMDDSFPYQVMPEYRQYEFALDSIHKAIHSRLKQMEDNALYYHSRDSLWRRLVAIEDNNVSRTNDANMLTMDDFILLSMRYNAIALTLFDDSLSEVFELPGVDWNLVFDHCMSHYGRRRAKEVHEKTASIRHLILLNPANEDSIIHLSLTGCLHIRAEIVGREIVDEYGGVLELSPGDFGQVDLEFMSEVITSLLSFILHQVIEKKEEK
jgi:hypothetical protein